MPRRELNRVRPRFDKRRNCALHVLDSREERGFAEEAVVDGHVEAAPVRREEPVEPDAHAIPANTSVSSKPRTPSLAPTAVVANAPTALAKRTARSNDQPASLP